MGKKKSGGGAASLGRSLVSNRAKETSGRQERRARSSLHHTTLDESAGAATFTSVLDVNDLTEFMLSAELGQRDFVPERRAAARGAGNMVVVAGDTAAAALGSTMTAGVTTKGEMLSRAGALEREQAERLRTRESVLRIPRRPQWDDTTTPEQLELMERNAFLEWRRALAQVEDELGLASHFSRRAFTPFEKNLEIWRQLWRVVERSDVVCQIVDARNPLLYFCEDLATYVSEFMHPAKKYVLLLNKADYLSPDMLGAWADYLRERNIEFYFFSAVRAAEASEKDSEASDRKLSDSASQSSSDASDDDGEGSDASLAELQSDSNNSSHADAQRNGQNSSQHPAETPVVDDNAASGQGEKIIGSASNDSESAGLVLSLDELLDLFHQWTPSHKSEAYAELHRRSRNDDELSENDETALPGKSRNPMESRCVVGMVGYPNVGKSSTINAIMGSKRVAVSATPGKTKHFQSFVLDDHVVLCDCPGLVFPNFSTSRADLVCNGVLPIDQMRDPVSPVELIVTRIPTETFEEVYGIRVPKGTALDPHTLNAGLDDQESLARRVLAAHARARGFMSDHGKPDVHRSARIILKDYAKGKLVYCHAPPGSAQAGAYSVAGPNVRNRGQTQKKIPAVPAPHSDSPSSSAARLDGPISADPEMRKEEHGLTPHESRAPRQKMNHKAKKSFSNGVTIRGPHMAQGAHTGTRIDRAYAGQTGL
ncbi:Large subunit GTPase 1-like [Porphyridium purpureum]|uniref:Large subunit GTPase 1-like n=1 Tax=Porphyridium purpureum TaxID=35688 RepID=A0A5J4YYD6_PORPP|nr:Large subunit GTPase 1-like [Porphyridium purpureum]|eukprot:POR9772..scf208_2